MIITACCFHRLTTSSSNLSDIHLKLTSSNAHICTCLMYKTNLEADSIMDREKFYTLRLPPHPHHWFWGLKSGAHAC
jgi:hypothetical protein